MRTRAKGELGEIPDKDLMYQDESVIDDFDDKYYQIYVKQEIRFTYIKMLLVLAVVIAIIVYAAILVVESERKFSDIDQNITEMSNVTQNSKYTLQRVSGKNIEDSVVWVDISCKIGEYIDILQSGTEYSRLDALCLGGSSVYNNEKTYREAMQYTGDANDCSARALRELGTTFESGKITDIIESDGIYYCYMDLVVPSKSDLWEYYLVYAYDITRYVSTRELNAETLTSCMAYIFDVKDIPTEVVEVELKFKKHDSEIYLVSDTYFAQISEGAFDETIECMVDLLGNKLSPEDID